jgi:hypothetical protein
MVSLPVLNPRTILNNGFDTYRLMDNHNDMRAMIREMRFPEDKPSFYLLNVGETHYPYALPDEPPESWPRISGVHGVFKHLDDHVVGGKVAKSEEKFFNQKALDDLRARQVKAVKYLDRVVEELFDVVPKNTYITTTKLENELGWRASETLHSGLARTVAWYLDNREWWEPLRHGVYRGERLGLVTPQASTATGA